MTTTSRSGQPPPVTVVVPAGPPLLEASRWVGESCWMELHVHEALTALLSSDVVDADQRVALWRVRSNRADTAEAWHRRLPELREFPRETFVVAPDELIGEMPSVRVDVPGAAAWLSRLHERYQEHVDVAVGPADGPVAGTLRWALGLLAHDQEAVAIGSTPPLGHQDRSAP